MTDNQTAIPAGQALTIPKVETLKAELEKRREERLQKKISNYPRKNLILSDLGDCDRQMAYGVKEWKHKPLPDTKLQARFEVGNLIEREMTRELLEMGFDFVGGQDTVTVQGKGGVLLATGRIDGFIQWERERIPVEFKSMNPNIYDQVESIEDFQKKPWLRKYTRQLMMYMFGHGKEYGLFGLNNCLGGIKWFILYLDLGECELLLQRMENVVKHLAIDSLPDRIEYRHDICGRCDFADICLPDVIRDQASVVTDEEVLGRLSRRDLNALARKQYESDDKWLKEQFANVPKAVAGEYYITGKEMSRRAYAKGPELEPTKYWKVEIQKLGGDKK